MRNLNTILVSILLCSCSLFSKKTVNNHQVIHQDFWSNIENMSLENRILTNEDSEVEEFIELWKKENSINYDVNLGTDPINKKDVTMALKVLPKVLYDYVNKHIEAVVIVSGLNIPLAIQPLIDKPGKFLLFLDPHINALGLNDWYLWREYSAFQVTQNDLQIETFLSHRNNTVDTMHFVLAQAMALIISWDEKLFPKKMSDSALRNIPVIRRSWINNKGIIKSKYESELEEIKFISFYGRSYLNNQDEKILDHYKQLEKTNFTNLYSSTGPLRDYVESLAIYLHTVYFQRPFHIDFFRNGELIDSFTHCLNRPRCVGKAKDIRSILKRKLK